MRSENKHDLVIEHGGGSAAVQDDHNDLVKSKNLLTHLSKHVAWMGPCICVPLRATQGAGRRDVSPAPSSDREMF